MLPSDYEGPYRVSEADSEWLEESLKAIKEATYRLSGIPHACSERYCDYCNALQDKLHDYEMNLRRITKNPITKKDAESLELFLRTV